MNVEEGETPLLYANFNQDFGCFALGLQNGFRIYNSEPLKERSRREFREEGIAIVEMLFRYNLLALVGGGKNPKFSPNKVIVWDENQQKARCELEFRSVVKAVRLRRDRIVVVLENKVYVYTFPDNFLTTNVFETYDNPKGIVAMTFSSTESILAIPGRKKGQLLLADLASGEQSIFTAHNSPISAITISQDGTLMATASQKGTLVRIWDVKTRSLVQELRRGADRALIHSLAFNYNAKYLVVSSDKGTIHVFSVDTTADKSTEPYAFNKSSAESPPPNKNSAFSFMKGMLPKYFSSEWSLAQFHIEENHSIAAFGQEKNTVVVVTSTGVYYKFGFDPSKRENNTRQDNFILLFKTGFE